MAAEAAGLVAGIAAAAKGASLAEVGHAAANATQPAESSHSQIVQENMCIEAAQVSGATTSHASFR